MCDEACSNKATPWRISDHDRHVREMQSVSCKSSFAQDHTHEVCKNYFQKKRIGANALWGIATETGEIASAVLVPSTKTIHFAHAAAALTRRPSFKPTVMHSDTWPSKSDFWDATSGNALQGRLGLFHHVQRLTRTLKKKHMDHFAAITSLLHCVHTHNNEDHENLLRALKEGTLSTKHNDDEMSDLKSTKVFRQRCDRYLRKEIRPPHILCSMLDDWFDQFKCTSSDGSRPARGRKDLITGDTLFSSETKTTVEECKKKASCIQDPLPLEQMYDVMLPSINSPHQLKEHISHRGESCLESFHLMLAHFGNCGMRTSLADNLNLTGTARFNLSVRHRRRLIALTPENTDRKKIPAAYESIVSFFNHSELHYINNIAIQSGVSQQHLPFKQLEDLQPDNGERFFSEHLDWMRYTKPRYDKLCRCLCVGCRNGGTQEGTQEESSEESSEEFAHCYPNYQRINFALNPQPHQEHQPLEPPPPELENPNLETPNMHQQTNEQVDQIQRFQQPQPQQHHSPTTTPPQPMTHQHHQQQQAIMHLPMPPFFTPFATHWVPPAFPLPPPPPPPALCCCSRFRCWLNTDNRRGRPPHDYHCQRVWFSETGRQKKKVM